MKGIRIGKWQPLGGVRLKSWAIYSVLLLLGLGNVLASVFEWHDGVGMMIFNGICVVGLVAAVAHKVLTMEPRKMWRVLAFLLSAIGVAAIFYVQVAENELQQWLKILLYVVGVLLLTMGGVSMVRWRRYSFERREELLHSRRKKENNS